MSANVDANVDRSASRQLPGPVRIGITGIHGRMGRELVAAAERDADVELVGGLIRAGSARLTDERPGPVISDRLDDLLPAIDVLIDFTESAASLAYAEACARAGRPIVIGTTGFTPAQLGELRKWSRIVPVFHAPNMSVGLNALLSVIPDLVRALDGYDAEIVEVHHRHKVDAPSGTALALLEAISSARAAGLPQTVFGRHGSTPRQCDEVGVHAVRAGGNPGEHTVLFASEGEEIALVHRAYARGTFALGALRAAQYVCGQTHGFYGMEVFVSRELRVEGSGIRE